MPVDLSPFLSPLSEDPPCGANLEYDAAWTALELAARGKPEMEMGDRKIEAVPPEWPQVREQAEALFARTRDIRIAVQWTRAVMHLEDLAGYVSGTLLVNAMLGQWWDEVHPRVEDGDPVMRANAVHALFDSDDFVMPMRALTVAKAPRLGKVTVRDLLVSTSRLQAADGETARPLAEIEDIIRAYAVDNADAIELLRAPLDAVNAIAKLMYEKAGPENAPETKPVRDLLMAVAEVVNAALAAINPSADESPAEESAQGAGVTAPGAAPRRPAGELQTRTDAVQLLERVCVFMEQSEPTNPAPLLIRRAQRLMQMSFVEIIEDMAPDSLSTIRSIAGLKEEA